jgi:hypothetical protein
MLREVEAVAGGHDPAWLKGCRIKQEAKVAGWNACTVITSGWAAALICGNFWSICE